MLDVGRYQRHICVCAVTWRRRKVRRHKKDVERWGRKKACERNKILFNLCFRFCVLVFLTVVATALTAAAISAEKIPRFCRLFKCFFVCFCKRFTITISVLFVCRTNKPDCQNEGKRGKEKKTLCFAYCVFSSDLFKRWLRTFIREYIHLFPHSCKDPSNKRKNFQTIQEIVLNDKIKSWNERIHIFSTILVVRLN